MSPETENAVSIVAAMLCRVATTGEHSGRWGHNEEVEKATQAILSKQREWFIKGLHEGKNQMKALITAPAEPTDTRARLLDLAARRTTMLAMELAYECLTSFNLQASEHPAGVRARDICYTLLGTKHHKAEPNETHEVFHRGAAKGGSE